VQVSIKALTNKTFANGCPGVARLSGLLGRARTRNGSVAASMRGRTPSWRRMTRPICRSRRRQGMVDAVWLDIGVRYPSAVEPLPRQATATLARANRLSVLLPPRTPSWCLLHELAQTMVSMVDGRSDLHGPAFMGSCVRLVARYLPLDPASLIPSAANAGIAVDADARPAFIDP